MKKFITLILMVMAAILPGVGAQSRVTVVDSTDGSAIAGATVLSGRGIILGVTDERGMTPYDPSRDLPLTIQSIGYEPVTISTPADILRMIPASYSLGEVTVATDERPVTRVLCYAREYASSATTTDTMQLFSEYMLEMFVAPPKTKGYKKGDAALKPLGVRRFSRMANAAGLDSVARPSADDDIVLLSFLQYIVALPSEPIEENERIAAGATADTIPGKYYARSVIRKTPRLYTISQDILSDHEGHRWSPWFFKLFGMTSEFKELNRSIAFSTGGAYDLNSLISESYNMSFTCTGKLLKHFLHTKDGVDINCYIEIYPVDVSHHSIAEYKEMRKEHAPEPLTYPADMPPLPAAVADFISRANR